MKEEEEGMDIIRANSKENLNIIKIISKDNLTIILHKVFVIKELD